MKFEHFVIFTKLNISKGGVKRDLNVSPPAPELRGAFNSEIKCWLEGGREQILNEFRF